MGLAVQYLCGNTAAMTGNVSPEFKITNSGTSSVPLAGLTIRYFFTSDGSTSFGFACNFAQIGCASVTGSFGTFVGTNSDHYLEVGFTGTDVIGPGGNSGVLQLQFHDATFMVTFTQTNDYSFDPTKTAFADWSNVTLYQDGVLVWGTEP